MTYDEIFTFENLLNAHLKARRGRRNKKDVITFELNLSAELWSLVNRLSNRTYEVSGYHKFNIYEPKEREIQALEYKDRVVQHALCDLYLYPLLTAHFIYDNCACQKGKGTDFALDRLSLFFRKFYRLNGKNGYILKVDVKKYFPSIDHDVLKEKLSRIIKEPDILILVNKIIDSYNFDSGKGIPMGNQTSQLFALYYLDSIDRFIKEKLRIKYYVRYMDDMILIHEDKEYLRQCLEMITVMACDDLRLQFNEKTQLFPIKNGVDFLGFHFYMTDTGKVIRKLRQSSKKRFKKRMKSLANQYAHNEIDLDDIKRTLPGYNGHLKRGNTYLLRRAVFKDFVLKREEDNF